MTDFALTFPRVAELALAYHDGAAEDSSDRRAAIVAACLADIPRDPWRASDRLVRLVAAVADLSDGAEARDEGGPRCGHGFARAFCGLCTLRYNAEHDLIEHVVRLARAS